MSQSPEPAALIRRLATELEAMNERHGCGQIECSAAMDAVAEARIYLGLRRREALATADNQQSIGDRHTEHYRSCECLGDSAVCCDQSCTCREAADNQPSVGSDHG